MRIGIDELELDNLLPLLEGHIEAIKESGLTENGDNAGRVTETGIEREGNFAGKVDLHVGEDGADVSCADAAIAVLVLGVERQAKLGGDFKRE